MQKIHIKTIIQISKVQKIDCNKLDNVPSIKIIDFLKLDTEGSELSILEGAYNLLKKKNFND